MKDDDPNKPASHIDPNPLPEGREVDATLFQAGQLVATGKAEREGKYVCFRATDRSSPPHSLRTPITLKVSDTDAEVSLRMAAYWGDHLKCAHWDFEIEG